MKKILTLIILALGITVAHAQNTRLNVYGSYVFDDGFGEYVGPNSYYNGKVKGGLQWGGGIEFKTKSYYGVELVYLYKGSDVPSNFKLTDQGSQVSETFKANLHYILLGTNRYMMSENGKVESYGGFLFGILINDVEAPSRSASSSNTVFAWGFRLGANIWASDRVGIKLQSQILAATRGAGGELYYGYWGPVTVPDYATLWQFGLGGGLTFRLGR